MTQKVFSDTASIVSLNHMQVKWELGIKGKLGALLSVYLALQIEQWAPSS
jgi:hypothetical protein